VMDGPQWVTRKKGGPEAALFSADMASRRKKPHAWESYVGHSFGLSPAE
jgi:hypothetical protein